MPLLGKCVCRQVVAQMVVGITVAAQEEGSARRLNLVQVQNPCARVTVSQGATARRQDIPAQDEETSVTTCYANP